MNITAINLVATIPLLFLAGWSCLLLLVDLWIPKTKKAITAWLAFLGLVVTLILVIPQLDLREEAFGGMLAIDGFSGSLHILFLGTGGMSVLLAINYLKRNNIERGEFYPLVLFSVIGMMTMAMAKDMIVVFLALELLSIPLYILAGFARARPDSSESALKYFLLGAFSSAFLVYGIALVYGATGATGFSEIASSIAAEGSTNSLLLSGVGMILVGLGFKVAAVPFHMWTPDVYEGAPTLVTAFMSVGSKAGGFAALIRVLFDAFGSLSVEWVPVVAILAALSMILGNVAAIAQYSIKRMLAYSSIAHAGYILMTCVAGGIGDLESFAASAVLFYLIAYALTNIGTWAIVISVERDNGRGNSLDDFTGLGKTHPGLALAMALFMLSLTGLPPTMGFVGKFYVFRVALEADYLWLVLLGVITSLISAYYYLRVVAVMWMREGPGLAVTTRTINLIVAITSVGTLVFGLLPGSIMALVENAVQGVF